jgi:murein DD-endopeptidase MepM/ murein hydrolase activator NlpD
MFKNRYRYNPATCRYEPVPKTLRDILLPVLIYTALTAGISFSLLFLHSAYVTTEKEQLLKNENQLLEQHYTNLFAELQQVRLSLASLQETDQFIQRELIAARPSSNSNAKVNPSIDAESIEFSKLFNKTHSATAKLLDHTRNSNSYFSQSIHFDSQSKSLLSSLPTLLPIDLINPEQIASGYGMRINPFHKGNYIHTGVDFLAPRGTDVYATASGRVVLVRKNEFPMGEGNQVEIDHDNGFKTRFNHLGEILVKPGQKVEKGNLIARVGVSGSSIAPHLHYEIIWHDKPVNPADFFMENLSSTDYAALLKIAGQKKESLD